MKRFSFGILAALLVAAIVPALAAAKIIELGKTATAVGSPSCPSNVSANNCTIVLTRVTALPTLRDGIAYPTKVRQSGYIVAFTLGISGLTNNRTLRKGYIHNLDSEFNGVPLVYVSVLEPVGSAKNFEWKVVADSSASPIHLIPYLGTIQQFPLTTALPVKPGDVVALTTPTWAPVLAIQQNKSRFAYRQSRTANCNSTPALSQAQIVGGSARYKCNYAGTRVEFTATEVTTPSYPKNYVHAPDRP
jgi:hypothetical protein